MKKILLTELGFIGLNNYSHYAFKFVGDIDKSFAIKPFPGETVTDMDYGMYPEEIYRAIARIAAIGKPIIVTDNGLADDLRAEFIDKSCMPYQKPKQSEGF